MTSQTTMPIEALRGSVRLTDPHTVHALRDSDRVLLGLAAGDEPVHLPPDGGHLLVATGGGGGTTTVLRSVAAQALQLGTPVDILDLDGHWPSHTWAVSLPGVQIRSRIEDIHDYLVDSVDQLRQNHEQPADFRVPRRLVVVEHADRIMSALRGYWTRTRPESQLDEATGVEALSTLVAIGHQIGRQVVVGSTRGIPPYRGTRTGEGFTTRIVAYGGQALWERIAPEVSPVPPCSVIPGRMHTVHNGTSTRMQALYLSEPEARAWANGIVPEEYR
ncbi:cell division protein FtsK [Streptomyces sp. NPDC050204]|uniref:cell division protein FtsK n=1 Tax=Streptomyces sp. NPDC050204 TaxID=3155514 RepID=UPI00341E0CD3